MSFRMEFIEAAGTLRFTLGCGCGATRAWDNELCYVAWRTKVAREGWKADWPERCPACKPGALREIEPHAYAPDLMAMGDCQYCGRVVEDPVHVVEPPLKRRPAQGVLPL